MVTNSRSMQFRRMVLLLVPFLLMMQLVNANVIINNNSAFTVSVYDTTTTQLIDPLGPNSYTTFNLGSAGPDNFIVKKLVGGVAVSSCSVKVVDTDTLLLYSSGNALMYIISNPNPPKAAERFTFNSVMNAAGSFCA